MADRCIASRLFEACAIETIACFSADPWLTSQYSDGRGTWRVKPYPFLPGEAAEVTGREVRVGVAPPKYLTGVGGVSDVPYVATFQFAMPLEAVRFKMGTRAKTWQDDVHALRKWLYKGGTKPNQVGALADPDYQPGPTAREFLMLALVRYEFSTMRAASNRNFLVEVDAEWVTREDSQGNRA